MTDTEVQIDLAAYTGKKVTFTLNLDEPNADGVQSVGMEGEVVLVNGPAMIIKPKGSAMNRLIELRNILDGSLAQVTEKPRELKARRLDPISLSNARYHLLDRHGYQLGVVNDLTDEAAFQEHGDIDHDRLGHFHATRDEAAVADDSGE